MGHNLPAQCIKCYSEIGICVFLSAHVGIRERNSNQLYDYSKDTYSPKAKVIMGK